MNCDVAGSLDVLMESKGGKKKSSSSSLQYEAPLGYSIEDVRPHGGVKKFQSAAYSNVMEDSKILSLFQNLFDVYNAFLMESDLLFDMLCLFCSALGSLLDKLPVPRLFSAGIVCFLALQLCFLCLAAHQNP